MAAAHAGRHWFTAYLLRAGIKREYVQRLRGDAIKEAVDIYLRLTPKMCKKLIWPAFRN
jgi:integrase